MLVGGSVGVSGNVNLNAGNLYWNGGGSATNVLISGEGAMNIMDATVTGSIRLFGADAICTVGPGAVVTSMCFTDNRLSALCPE